MILAPAKLGLLGGGQLGRYFVMAAHELGYEVTVLDPDPDSVAGRIADEHLIASYEDEKALMHLAGSCQVVTTEFENVPATSLARLEAHLPVRPGARILEICQDRLLEKSFFAMQGLPHAPFSVVRSEADIMGADPGLFPGILKVSRFGYDGKGQAVVQDRQAARDAFLDFGGALCVLERKLQLDSEVSVILARDPSGNCAAFPLVENRHKGGILDFSLAPAALPAELAEEIRRVAFGIAERLGYVGVLAIEFFIVGGKLCQRTCAPPAQLGPLQPGRLHHQPVRTAGQGDLRASAGKYGIAVQCCHVQPSGRHLVQERSGLRAGLVETARRGWTEAASLWQEKG